MSVKLRILLMFIFFSYSYQVFANSFRLYGVSPKKNAKKEKYFYSEKIEKKEISKGTKLSNQGARSQLESMELSFASVSLMDKLKYKGCMFNGILNQNIPDIEENLSMINRSPCFYLPRIVETWLIKPDYQLISQNLMKLKEVTNNKELYLGAFLAEAISVKDFYINNEGKSISFETFCKKDSKNFWGEGSCIPDLGEQPYQDYVSYMINELTNIGIRDFLFGQIHLIDPQLKAIDFYNRIRLEQNEKGRYITIGAQVGVANREYLQKFDYILGGSYITKNGEISMDSEISGESSAAKTSPLLWSKKYREKARNVIIEFDWWNIDDDIHRFALLSEKDRISKFETVFNQFKKINVGLIFPYRIPLGGGVINGSCFGIDQWNFSASNKYSCKAEDGFREIMQGKGTASSSSEKKIDGDWSDWGPCSQECGAGIQTRSCVNPMPINGGADCIGSNIQECNTQACKELPLEERNAKLIYKMILGREPDPGGLEYTSSKIKAGVNPMNIAVETLNSEEFKKNNESKSDEVYIKDLYKNILGRDYDQGGLEFCLSQLKSGAKSRIQIAEDFLRSDEFKMKHQDFIGLPQSYEKETKELSKEEYNTQKIYNIILARSADPSGLTFTANKLNSGISPIVIAIDVCYSDEFKKNNESKSNEQFLTDIYRTILNRAPDPFGYEFNLKKLNSGERSKSQLVEDFLRSAEFERLHLFK